MIGTPNFVLCRNEATHIYFCQFRGRLCYYIEDKVGVCIIDSIPHCNTKYLSKEAKIKKCGFVSILENLSSIVFHTVLLKMLSKIAKIKICDFVSA